MKARRINLGQPTGRPAVIAGGRSGFSLIELLVVIGVILILVGIATVGISSIVASAHQRQTRTMLEAAAALVNEYNVEMRKKGITEWYWESPPAPTLSPPNYNVDSALVSSLSLDFQTRPYRYKAPYPGSPTDVTDPASPMPVPIPNYSANEGKYYATAWQMQNTLLLMRTIGRLPATNKVLSQLSKKSAGSGAFSGPNPGNVTVLQDAWGHPLLFVPATGLGDGTTTGSVYAGAKVDSSNPSGTLIGGTILPTIKSPDGKAFWASAGPDGDFRTGDDNLYSFGEQ